jgi:hypothetical protein
VDLCLDSPDGSPRVPTERIYDLPCRPRAPLQEPPGLKFPADAVQVVTVVAGYLGEFIVVE